MTDVMTPEQRSRNMSRIRGRDTGPEIRLRKRLWKQGYRYRINHPALPGKPDLAFMGSRLAVFVDGCFWHGCPLHCTQPKTNAEFWRRKIKRNIQRDREVDAQLAALGWRVLRIWEHEVEEDVDDAAERVIKALRT